MKKQQDKKVFNLQEVGFNDLDGNFTTINFDQKDFANALFKNAQSIDMDAFAKEIHAHGEAEVNEVVHSELSQLVPGMYQHRVAQAIIETIEKLK